MIIFLILETLGTGESSLTGETMNATADGLASTLVESDDEGRVVASHPTSINENDASSTTLLEANFDHQGFSDGFTLHVPVCYFCICTDVLLVNLSISLFFSLLFYSST